MDISDITKPYRPSSIKLPEPKYMGNHGNSFISFAGVTSAISDTDLKALWNMSEASGNLLNSSLAAAKISNSDLVPAGTNGHGATGKIAGLDAYDYAGGNGDLTKANGNINDYSFITKSGGVFTFMWWMKIDLNTATEDIFGSGSSGSTDFQIRHRGAGDDAFAIFFMNEGEQITTLTVTDTNYHFYMLQYDDAVGDLKMSVDDGSVETVASGLNITNTTDATQTWTFGDVSTANEFNGQMQQFLMFNKIVSAGDITTMDNSGSGVLFYT